MRKQRGITLIALVITIIVLLILASVSITAIMGDNGILKRALLAKQKTESATEIETISLALAEVKMEGTENIKDSLKSKIDKNVEVIEEDGILKVKYNDTNNEYVVTSQGQVLNMKQILAEAKPHPEQSEMNSAIGVSEDGSPVNMDLWSYIYDESLDGYELTEMDGSWTMLGYYGEVVNGKIEGQIPMYILETNGSIAPTTFKLVKSLPSTFNGVDIEYPPEIPPSVTSMNKTFFGCSELKIAPKLPKNIKNLYETFAWCTTLKEAPEIPEGATWLYGMFWRCTALEKAPKIPESATSIGAMFRACTIETAPVIPSNVTVFECIFEECANLKGEIVVNGNPGNVYESLKGTATIAGEITLTGDADLETLQRIAATADAGVNVIIKK